MAIPRFSLLYAFGLLFLCAKPLQAASFNCNEAKRPIEVAICSTPELSSADESLSEVYHSLLGKLTADGAKKLVKVQREFIKRTRDSCERSGADSLNRCALINYKERIDLLERLDKSGLNVTLNGKFESWKSDDEASISAIWPEIDSPAELAEKINKIIKEKITIMVPDDQSNRSYELTFHINALNQDMISIDFMSSYLPSPKWAMANYSWETLNFLPGKLREPTPGDFFADGADWIELLTLACEKKYEKSGIVIAVEDDAGEWGLSPGGITFACGEQMGMRGPIPEATLSWDDIRSKLKTDALIPRSQ